MKHGEEAGYQAGCREACCGRAKARAAKLRRIAVARGQVFQVPSDRARRKVQALACLGWSAKDVGRLMGITQQAISRILARDTIRSSTMARIDAAYAELEMKIPADTEWTRRTKNAAAKAGAKPPLAWEDIDAGILADDLTDKAFFRGRFDEGLVDYVMQYHDFSVRLTPAEKSEVVRRWTRSVGSERQLCQLTGWREARYRVPRPTQEAA